MKIKYSVTYNNPNAVLGNQTEYARDDNHIEELLDTIEDEGYTLLKVVRNGTTTWQAWGEQV